MQVLCCQIDTAWEDKQATHRQVDALLEDRSIEPGSLIVLPEMFDTGFSLRIERTAEDDRALSQRFLSQLAQRCEAFVVGGIVMPVCNPDPSGLPSHRGRNEAVVYGPDGALLGRYAKFHPFSFAQEDKHIEPGSELYLFSWRNLQVAPLVCYDLRFPEVFRAVIRQGAGLCVVIANWPQTREDHWWTLLRARAIENQAFVVGVNRCGRDPNHAYGGRSCVVSPRGEILAEAGRYPCVLSANINADEVDQYRNQFPALNDMRKEFFPVER